MLPILKGNKVSRPSGAGATRRPVVNRQRRADEHQRAVKKRSHQERGRAPKSAVCHIRLEQAGAVTVIPFVVSFHQFGATGLELPETIVVC